MRRLRDALSATLPDVTNLGGEGRNIDRARLVEVLDKLTIDLSRSYWLRMAIMSLVLAVLAGAAWQFGRERTLLAAALIGLLVCLVGALCALQQVTAELARAGMLRAMATDISLEALTEVAHRIAKES